MHHYDVLFVEKEFPGLHIITAESYQLLKQQQPQFPHQDWGDFYSEVALDALADKIYQSLQKAGAAEEARIVDVRLFDEKSRDLHKDYIIREKTGVRIYSPSIHQKDHSLEPESVYALGSLYFLEDLFSSEKEGSLQREFKQLGILLDQASTALKKVPAEVENLTKEVDEAFRIFDKALKKDF